MRVVFLDRRGLHQVERLSLRNAFDDVDDDDVGQFFECDSLRNRGADVAAADHCDFRFHLIPRVRYLGADYRRSSAACIASAIVTCSSGRRILSRMLSDFCDRQRHRRDDEKVEKERLLADYLVTLDDASLERAVVFFSGSPFPRRTSARPASAAPRSATRSSKSTGRSGG